MAPLAPPIETPLSTTSFSSTGAIALSIRVFQIQHLLALLQPCSESFILYQYLFFAAALHQNYLVNIKSDCISTSVFPVQAIVQHFVYHNLYSVLPCPLTYHLVSFNRPVP